jgi:hypothetical protein
VSSASLALKRLTEPTPGPNAVCLGIVGDTPMAMMVTKDNDPDIVDVPVAAEPIERLGERPDPGAKR